MLYLLLLFIQRYRNVFPLFRLPGISNKNTYFINFSFFTRIYRIWFSLFFNNYNRNERIMLKAEQFVKSKDWRSVLEYTKKYLDTGRYNQLISYFHHLALYHTGQLPYHLLDYPQNRESRDFTSRGTVTVVRVNTDIFFMKNLGISMRHNAGSLSQW